ncbi:metal-dependent hydrolase [Zafaria cholistanensis]|uniref:Metal-dependent hydrolase n=1 Tax=Zafaria cholistanensis TaxID=1682741 RepID=A0A5A7NP74_9MICC|nr:M48 family metallopeptidase [Zafaria cholistanensis]GER21847.1 metal-dependent hydrolase [Zafaria cholistanensis]
MPAHPKEHEFTSEDGVRVRILRSSRRTRTVSASWRDGAAVVSVPARLSTAQEQEWVRTMVQKLREGRSPDRRQGGRTAASDADLYGRAQRLDTAHLGGRARPASVRWVSNQNSRWGSATPADGSIRLSDRLRGMPGWVQDYVLVHELAHLLATDGHGPEFRALEARYPRTAEAKAYLEGVSFALHRLGPGPVPGGCADGGQDRGSLDDPARS